MAGALPARILVHTAVPVSYLEDVGVGEWIAGERGPAGPEPSYGQAFACVLFMPSPGGEADSPYRPRVVRTPTLLFNPSRDLADGARGLVADGSLIVVSNQDDLLIEAPELAAWTGAATARWQADGDGQPFGPPGSVIGVQATLRMVRD